MNLTKLLTLTISFVYVTNVFALVDYTEDEPDFKPANTGAQRVTPKKAPTNTSRQKAPRRKASNNSGPSGMFNVATSYELVEVKTGEVSGKANIMKINTSFHTNYNIFMNASYWQADTKTQAIGDKNKTHKGNPEVILGFNWLQLGSADDAATVDIYGGASIGQSNSAFASERTDKIVGVTTSKRFMDFAFGLGYEYRLTGSPDGDEEMAIGNIQKLSASLGWMVSPDIQFAFEGGTYRVSESKDDSRANRLKNGFSFGYLKPGLMLGISPMININLGAVYRTKRIKEDKLISAKLWSLEGAYGNSVYAGLHINI